MVFFIVECRDVRVSRSRFVVSLGVRIRKKLTSFVNLLLLFSFLDGDFRLAGSKFTGVMPK